MPPTLRSTRRGIRRLVSLAAGLKRRDGVDKWVLRQAFADLLPAETVLRPKLGIHEGSGTTSFWSEQLLGLGVDPGQVHATKTRVSRAVHDLVVARGTAPDDVDLAAVTEAAVERGELTA